MAEEYFLKMDWRGKQIAPDNLTDEQRKLLGGRSAALQRPNNWGSIATLLGHAAPPAIPSFVDVPFLNVGPFDEPCELEVSSFTPDIVAAELEMRITVGLGHASRTYVQALVPGASVVLVAQSLSVAIRRTDVAGLPEITFSLWCNRRVSGLTNAQLTADTAQLLVTQNALIAKPPGLTVFDSSLVVFGATVPQVTVTPPAGATWAQTARTGDTLDLDILQFVGGTTFSARAMTNGAESHLVALDPLAAATLLQRSPSVNAANNLIKWLR